MSKTSIKLYIDKKKNKVLFAEAGKQFVDFLFHLFVLPVGTVVSLLTQENMVGSLGNLYESVESLSSSYMQLNADKEFILKPKKISSNKATHQPLLLAEDLMSEPKIFTCSIHSLSCVKSYVSSDPSLRCPGCGYSMTNPRNWVGKKVTHAQSCSECNAVGYVKSLATYIVMDDLAVKPLSAVSSITTLLEKFNIKDVSLLEVKAVDIMRAEGLKLLKESLSSQTVLTNVFLHTSSPKRLKRHR